MTTNQIRAEESWANARFAEWSAAQEAADDRREAIEQAQGDIFGSAELAEAIVEAIADASGEDLTKLVRVLRRCEPDGTNWVSDAELGALFGAIVRARVTAWAEQRVDLADDE